MRVLATLINKLMSVFRASVLLFRHNIVKVGDSRVDPQTTLTKFVVNKRAEA